MRRPLLAGLLVTTVAAGALSHAADADPPRLATPAAPTAAVGDRAVHVTWPAYPFPDGTRDDSITVLRDGTAVATLAPAETAYDDPTARTGETHAYALRAAGSRGSHSVTSAPSAPASVTLPSYLVGASAQDITPAGVVHLGGFGLGDGSSPVMSAVTDPGSSAGPSGARIKARAIVVSDGTSNVAIADIETQGMFAAYEAKYGAVGLSDIAAQVAHDVPALPADHIVVASDHTHHGPDTIGAWGGVSADYLATIKAQTVKAIETAYEQRRYAELRAGESDASDLIYNQACTEALPHGDTTDPSDPQYPAGAPDACPMPGKDGMMRVLQARTPAGATVVTLVVYAAHSTTNMGSPIDGDWPQFLGDHLADVYGGVGIGMEGANGGTQPCRPTCWFTDKREPGYNLGRFDAIIANYSAHTADALAHAKPVRGPVAAAQRLIQEPLTGPFVTALFLEGDQVGAHLMRSRDAKWMNGQVVTTVASAVRIGDLLFDGTPGEGYPAIRQGVADAAPQARMVLQLGLANDQLGYLISPASYTAVALAEAAVNDNILFNVSPTIGDHVMCSDIALAQQIAPDWTVTVPPTCAPYTAEDALLAR